MTSLTFIDPADLQEWEFLLAPPVLPLCVPLPCLTIHLSLSMSGLL